MKFAHLYLVHLAKETRCRRRKARLGNARLLLWQLNVDAPLLTFTLLLTDGNHPARVTEPGLRDAHDGATRLVVTDYELVPLSRPGADRPALTWRMSAALIESWETLLRDLIRRHAIKGLIVAWNSLHRVPGFGPVRAEAKRLARDAEVFWQRNMRGPLPKQGVRIGYIRRMAHSGTPLSALVRRTS
jgi:hypothetical protein